METLVQFQVFSETIIKPSSPTPISFRYHKLSSIDQSIQNVYGSMAFFYQKSHASDDWPPNEIISQVLQIALSKTLTYYYPMAGRLLNNLFVDCNDTGAQFIEARIQCPMSEILKQYSHSQLKEQIFPRSLFSCVPEGGSLLIVQLNYFGCGSIAVGVCTAHKVADASTISTFMNDWAAMARRESSDFPSPHFNGASLFPPVLNDPKLVQYNPPNSETIVTKRFLFHASKIEELKAMAADSGLNNLTRYEVVTALIYSCAICATMMNTGSFRPSILANAVNIRSLTISPLPQKYVGNFVRFFPVCVTLDDEVGLKILVHKLRDGKIKFHNEFNEIGGMSGGEVAMVKGNEGNNFDVYYCSSLCTFPFYDVDFGWGRPSLVCLAARGEVMNTFILMDMEDGIGIDAHVMLKQVDMCVFERNELLRSFAYSDPISRM
ncbi:hypothetical protein ACH5RR_001283 [Cinchona calisaya]|uniref:Uncharacterized protein n=1 Tax=Cinchona calisaya TaxID=153742 RepID=A0ABD3B2Y0_9GENT